MATALTEGQHPGEFILWEGDPGNRELVTVLSGQVLKAGAVVARVAAGVGRASVPAVVGGGDGTMSAVYAGPEVERGNYVVKCTVEAANNGTFSVTTPSGKLLKSAVLSAGSVVYRSRHINFTITDGSADFDLNDTFTIVVGTTAPAVVGTGNGTIGSITLGPDARPGNYLLKCIAAAIDAGTFSVFGPDGERLADATVAVAYVSPQINFTIADGSSDYIVGDYFNVAVFNELAGGKVVAWDPTTVDGRQRAAGVLYDDVDATGGDLPGVIVSRYASVREGALQYAAGITAGEKASAKADLTARGVVVR